MVDISAFFDFYIKNSKFDIIKYGFEKSEFNKNIPFHKICQIMLEKRTYSLYNLALTGLPRKYNNKQKITFDKSFDLLIDNLQVIFNYEISKYILFRINSDYLLKRIRCEIENDNSNDELIEYFKLFFNIYNKFEYKVIDQINFSKEIKKTQFYDKHRTDNISGVINGINKDLDALSACNINMVHQICETSIKLLDIILKYSKKSENIVINSIDDLIINNLKKFDICYEGSFLRLWKRYYESNPNNDEIIKEYNMEIVLNELMININDTFIQIKKSINEVQPMYNIEFTDNFMNEIINIIFDFYIHLGIEMAKEHALNKCFAQSSKMHFKTLYTTLLRLLVKGDAYTESQLLVLHYALLTSDKLIKMCK